MNIFHEKIFGPVATLVSFESGADAIEQANDCKAGLGYYVFTRDLARAERCAMALEVGEVQINGVKYSIDLPHGGVKQSGIGHDCSHLALHDDLAFKRISRAVVRRGEAR